MPDTTELPLLRTIDRTPGPEEMLKPRELIEVYSDDFARLTKDDRRTFNLLVRNAWGPELAIPGHKFIIPTADLRLPYETDNRRLKQSIRRLQKTLVDIKLDDGTITTSQLLGPTNIDAKDTSVSGAFSYKFPEEMADVLAVSTVFAKLELDVLRLLSSKYAVALYEAVCRRANMRKPNEEMTIQQFRETLCVEAGLHAEPKRLMSKVIKPAVKEINQLSDYGCAVEPRIVGRKLVGYDLWWHRKDVDGRKEAFKARQSALEKVKAP